MPLIDFVFKQFSLSSAGASRTDDADIIASVGVNDNEQLAIIRTPDRDVTAFDHGMIGVGNGKRRHVSEDSRCGFKADAVLGEIQPRLA